MNLNVNCIYDFLMLIKELERNFEDYLTTEYDFDDEADLLTVYFNFEENEVKYKEDITIKTYFKDIGVSNDIVILKDYIDIQKFEAAINV